MTLNEFLSSLKGKSREDANKVAESICGIVDFFDSDEYSLPPRVEQANKIEYGDWQTNFDLACKVCLLVKNQGITPDVIIEPTCGIGTFIIASVIVFGKSAKDVYGIEIYKPYIVESKFRLLEYALDNPGVITSRIHLFHQSIFSFDFDSLKIPKDKNILIIGNPPWVTNSKLCEINSDNLPRKSNFKKVKGLDAVTGKANFDIAENITYQLLDSFHNKEAYLAFLVKNSVVKNVVYEQKKRKYQIRKMAQYNIDAKKEFDVSVAACLFTAKLGEDCATECSVKDLYSLNSLYNYGWVRDAFVSNIDDYQSYSHIDGECQLTWWSGLKHDCSKIMELEKRDGKLYNNLKEEVQIEPDLVYPILKSSDLKGQEVDRFRKYVIVTQKNIAEDTLNIKLRQPKTYKYLQEHSNYLDKRGSIIYKNRPKFSIFGIGEYSFFPYKIAIAGLYKSTKFSFIKPMENKCVMLDDTCYMLGFGDEIVAKCILKILNSNLVQRFMQSLVFLDAKRSINKDLLMRIDLLLATKMLFNDGEITQDEFELATNTLQSRCSLQLHLFE